MGDAERGLVLDAGRRLQEAGDLLGAQDDRQLARLVDERQMPSRVGPTERHGEKEPQRRDGGVDNRRARAVLGQVQLETTEILIGRRVRRSTEESCQFHNRADVVVLGLRREMADAHVLDHAPAKWGDAFLGHAILLSEARLLTPRSSDRTRPPSYRTPHDDTPKASARPPSRASVLFLWRDSALP